MCFTDCTAGYILVTNLLSVLLQVSAGRTQHVEAVQITFDKKQISYQKLLDVYFDSIDPTQAHTGAAALASNYLHFQVHLLAEHAC